MNHWLQAKRALRTAAAFSLIAMLFGCEAIPETSPEAIPGAAHEDPRTRWQAHLSWLESLSQWRVAGRVAVQVPDDGWSASLRWRQGVDDYRIALSGPFGQGTVRIDGTATEVVLRTADGRVRRAASAEQLVAAELNAAVPVSLLRFWLLGRPAPAPVVQEFGLDSLGRLQRLVQADWLITYQEYEAYDTGVLPARLQIEHERSAARFVLSSWHTGG